LTNEGLCPIIERSFHRMSEPLRTDPADLAPLSEADRAARIEQLLLSGLDHYFGGHYEQAINIWTRVAFLERGHGRARAYIERARGALAERQRESEELLHNGIAAYEAGDLQTARELLTQAVEQGGANDTALLFLQRLNRLDAVSGASRSAETTPSRTRPRRELPRVPETGSWLATIAACVVVVGAVVVLALAVRSWLVELPVTAPLGEPVQAEALPIVRASDARFSRARDLASSGRAHEAVALLKEIDIADPLRLEADRLTADIQRGLLARAVTASSAPAGETPR
jgi:tetratricopeptide (TPR) repeat protein